MKYRLLTLLLLLLPLRAVAQTGGVLRGCVVDEQGVPVIGATVRTLLLRGNGTTSDVNGDFDLRVRSAKDTVEIAYMGYEKLLFCPTSVGGERRKYVLKEEALALNEVVVSANRFSSKLTTTQIGSENIAIDQIKKMPTLFGETDIVKSITLLPGVKSAGDGTTGFQVRGGTAAQNLILLDDVPIYNAGHVVGIFSTFNDDVLSHATLYKGLVPAQFGGAASSILDVATQSGETSGFHAGFDIGLLSSNAYIQGPLANGKVSYQVAARRSYFDLFLKATDDYKDNTIYFYDINAKVTYKPTNNDRLSLALFSAKDRMGMKDLMDMDWGNKSASLQWFHRYGEHTTSNTSLLASDFSSANAMDLADMNAFMGGGVRTYAVKHRMDIESDRVLWNLGAQASLMDVVSGDFRFGGEGWKERRKGVESAAWVNADYKPSEAVSVSGGLRLTSFAALGGAPFYEFDTQGKISKVLTHYGKTDVVAHYLHLEPRLSANWRLTSDQSVKAGYARTTQNVYNILNASMGIPFTRYTMPSNRLKPIVSDQVSLAYTRLLADERYELSAEAYFKSINNVYDYKSGKAFTSDIKLESLVLGGRGRSYGLEMLAKKNLGRLTGWVAYTLSWTQNKIEGINNGEWYTATNDIRHDFSVVGMYELTDSWSVSASWIYQTGQALNAPSAKYEMDGKVVYYYAERNGYRAPAYHRMDLGFVHEKKRKRYTRRWSFGVYNAYMHYNPYVIKFEDDPTSPTGTKTTLTAMFGLLPSVTYGIHF